ncbi:9523_t:CDS:2 [Cetraspora pellucida]|uniref:9523_t:CDS:1 n=1 Tax=Cetraspora pellucida TaxID=1433469 RepID=A0A9N8VN03_9GLOM|nr:9523_t:CDS:2 [Cetraspora pellucida]
MNAVTSVAASFISAEKEYGLAIYNADRKEESEKIDKDLKDTEESFKNFDDVSIQQVGLVQSQIAKQPNDNLVKRISPKELSDIPASHKTNVSNAIKRFYKGYKTIKGQEPDVVEENDNMEI